MADDDKGVFSRSSDSSAGDYGTGKYGAGDYGAPSGHSTTSGHYGPYDMGQGEVTHDRELNEFSEHDEPSWGEPNEQYNNSAAYDSAIGSTSGSPYTPEDSASHPGKPPVYNAGFWQAVAIAFLPGKRDDRKYADFAGRSSRREFWWAYLFSQLVSFALLCLILFFFVAAFVDSPSAIKDVAETNGSGAELMTDAQLETWGVVGALLPFMALVIFSLYTLIPWVALYVRRLRDAGFHWAFVLLAFIPWGGIITLILCALPTKEKLARPAEDFRPGYGGLR